MADPIKPIPRIAASNDISVKTPLSPRRVEEIKKTERVMLENLTSEKRFTLDRIRSNTF